MISINTLIILLLWQPAIAQNLNFFYTDEIVTLLLGLYLFYALLTRRFIMKKYETLAFFSIICFYFMGALATIIYNYQGSIFFGLESGLFSVKSFICYFGARAWLCNKKIKKKALSNLLMETEVPLMVVAILLIFDQFVKIFPASNVRLGIRTSYFVFTHPVELSCYGVISLLLSVYLRNLLGLKNVFWRNYLPAIIVVLIAGRYKALGFVIFFLTSGWILPLVKKFKLRYLIMSLPLILVVTHNQIMFYFSDLLSNARGALYYYSVVIGLHYFPLGTGFGTFGTEFSRRRYSPIYYRYNMTGIYGMRPNAPMFVADTMWPAILGETGVAGALCIILFFVFLFIVLKKKLENKRLLFVTQCVIIYALFESVAASIFMSSIGCAVFFIAAFMLSTCDVILCKQS